MPTNTHDIRRRIKSIKNTAQITKAMQMVAAAKMRKAQTTALAGHDYAAQLNRVLVSVQQHVDTALHPLLEVRSTKRELVVVIATDKGLCGALNTNLLRETLDWDAHAFVSSGRKAQQALARLRRNLLADFPLPETPSLQETKLLSNFCIERFLAKEVDQVTVLYPKFVNTLTQEPTKRVLLPISPFDLPKAEEEKEKTSAAAASANASTEFLYEPNPMAILSQILPHYLHYEIYQMVLDARASEQSARMVAMKNATDNAQGLIQDLTLQYNKARQAAITTELLEIATAQTNL